MTSIRAIHRHVEQMQFVMMENAHAFPNIKGTHTSDVSLNVFLVQTVRKTKLV